VILIALPQCSQVFEVDVEDPFQALRKGSWRRDAPRVSCAPGRCCVSTSGQGHLCTQAAVRGEHTVKTGEIHARLGHGFFMKISPHLAENNVASKFSRFRLQRRTDALRTTSFTDRRPSRHQNYPRLTNTGYAPLATGRTCPATSQPSGSDGSDSSPHPLGTDAKSFITPVDTLSCRRQTNPKTP